MLRLCDNVIIFVVLKQQLLQQTETEDSFILKINFDVLSKIITLVFNMAAVRHLGFLIIRSYKDRLSYKPYVH